MMFAPKSLEEFIKLIEPIHQKSGEKRLTYKEKLLLLMEGSLLLSELAVKESFSLRFEPPEGKRGNLREKGKSRFVNLFEGKGERLSGKKVNKGIISYESKRRPGKILLIQLSSIGDVVTTIPAIRGLREKFGQAHLTLLTEDVPAPLVQNNPYLDEIIIFEREKFLSKVLEEKQPFEEIARELDSYLRRFVKIVRGKRFDLIINLHTTPRAALFSHLFKAKRISGLTIDEKGIPFVSENLWMLYKLFISCNPSMIDLDWLSHIQLNLKMAGVKPRSIRPRIYLSKMPNAKCQMPNASLTIGINPGTNIENKRWPASSFAELISQIKQRYDVQIVVFGGKNDIELAKAIIEQARVPALNLVGKTSLLELAQLLKKCHLLITNDTGPMHIAGAVGTKTIVLCGPTRYGPYGEGHLLLQADLPCIGCGASFPCQKMDCLKKIRVEDVLEAVRYSLGGELPELRGINIYSLRLSCQLPLFAKNEAVLISSEMIKILHLNLWAKEEARLNNEKERLSSLNRREFLKLYSYSVFEEALRRNLEVFKKLRSDLEEAVSLAGIQTKDKVKEAIRETNLSRIDFNLSHGAGRIFSFYGFFARGRLEAYQRKLKACSQIIRRLQAHLSSRKEP